MSARLAPVLAGTASTSEDDGFVLPVELHVFSWRGRHYLFDVRNYLIATVPEAVADVARRAHALTLAEIEVDLASQLPPEQVRRAYLELLNLIDRGMLSTDPVPRPARPPFQRLVLMLAGGCNMGCTYCFEKDVPIYQDLNLMTRETAETVLAWFFRHHEGPKAHLQMYGGEPTLNWPVLTYVVNQMEAWAAERGVELSKYIITNGTLLNPSRIAFFKEHGIRVQVSADGDAETHNHFRIFKSGKPTMEKIQPNIQELARQEVDFNLRAVLTRGNLNPESVTAGLRSLGAEKVSFEVAATDCHDARLSTADWDGFNSHYAAYLDRPFTTWAELPHEMQNTIIRLCDRQRIFYGCGAGVSEVTVAPDGNIYECQRIYRDPYSHVQEDRSPRQLDSSLLTMVDDRPVCQSCWARYLCGGGCMHQAHVEHGGPDPVPQYCTMKRGLVEAAIVKIHEIRALRKTDNGDA